MKAIRKESSVGFYAGFAGGFGFYLAWQLLSLFWQTSAQPQTAIKAGIGFFLGLVIGFLLYHGVYFFVNKEHDVTKITINTIFGIVAGLVIGFLVDLILNHLLVFNFNIVPQLLTIKYSTRLINRFTS
jgi:uncharacterized protein YacL